MLPQKELKCILQSIKAPVELETGRDSTLKVRATSRVRWVVVQTEGKQIC